MNLILSVFPAPDRFHGRELFICQTHLGPTSSFIKAFCSRKTIVETT